MSRGCHAGTGRVEFQLYGGALYTLLNACVERNRRAGQRRGGAASARSRAARAYQQRAWSAPPGIGGGGGEAERRQTARDGRRPDRSRPRPVHPPPPSVRHVGRSVGRTPRSSSVIIACGRAFDHQKSFCKTCTIVKWRFFNTIAHAVSYASPSRFAAK